GADSDSEATDMERKCRVLRHLPNKLRRFLLLLLCATFVCIPISIYVWDQATEAANEKFLYLTSLKTEYDHYTDQESIREVYANPAIDSSVTEDKDKILAALPNLPLSYRKKLNPHVSPGHVKCARYPSLFDIQFSNIYWQALHTSNGTFYLYNSFYDNRTLSKDAPSIRILGMANRIRPTVETNCQLWFDGEKGPIISKVKEYKYIWIRGWGNYRQGVLQPYLIQCVVPPTHVKRVPESVSLVELPCDKPFNNLRVIKNEPTGGQKEDFAVCVKGLDFSYVDNSIMMVEWLELLHLLGANKVFLYEMGIHPNVSKVLKYYESLGRVDITKLTLPGEQPNARGLLHMYLKAKMVHKRQNEVIPYNDCLYRNIYRYKYVVLLDTDEFIMPRKTPNWKSLIEQLLAVTEGQPRSSYCARNVYFLDSMQDAHGKVPGVPPYLHMMQHVYRAANYTRPGSYIKCFHNTERVLTLHNHFPFSCLNNCYHLSIPEADAHLQHYRKDCVGELMKSSCPYFKAHTVLDDRILKLYKELMVNNTLHTFRRLGFL
ncbi:putative Glycosyltransferase family 92-like 6, partial [Homarus americanus]